MYDNMATCSIRGLNGHRPITGYNSTINDNTFNNNARRYWKYEVLAKNKFFIDAASAYSWSGGQQAIPGSRYSTMQLDPAFGPISINDIPDSADASAGSLGQQDYFYGGLNNGMNPGNFYEIGESFYTTVGGSDYAINAVPGTENNPAWETEHMSNTPYDNVSNSTFGWATHSHYGNPSRGIWTVGEYSAMDLSWTNFGDSGVPVMNYEDSSPRPFNLQNAAEVQDGNFLVQGAWEFIKALCEPGTNFRFRNDPDQQVYTVYPFQSPYTDIGYDNPQYYRQPTTYYDGNWGIRNVHTATQLGLDDNAPSYELHQFADYNRRQRWTILTSPKIGDTLHGYNPIHGTDPEAMSPQLGVNDPNWRRALKHDNTGDSDIIEIITPFSQFGSHYSENPGVWETEPKEAVELDIYYQASDLIPVRFSDKTNEEFVPVGSNIQFGGSVSFEPPFVPGQSVVEIGDAFTLTVTGWDGAALQLDGPIQHYNQVSLITSYLQGADTSIVYPAGSTISFNLPNNSSVELTLTADAVAGDTQLNIDVENLPAIPIKLGWNNCWSFGNGVESDRIRDDFNAPEMDNGVKVSATVANPKIKEERRKYGMIWSDIYNSTAGVNNTNQFIAAEPITKDLNPSHGSIQALKARDTRLIMLCEDKILRADTNRDLLFNADGNSQVVSSNAVIGSAVAYKGDYGISNNPESLAVTPNNMFFTDVRRGKVLVLNDNEGARAISDAGMKDFFADLMAANVHSAIGSYDARKNEYNVSIGAKYGDQTQLSNQTTISYSEIAKGWSSFKDFKVDVTPTDGATVVKGLEQGVSLNNNYYTFFDGHIWKHHINETRNNFYGTQNTSDVTFLFNENPQDVKSFSTIDYEGSAARITNWDDAGFGNQAGATDGIGFYNNDSTTGSEATAGQTIVNNVSDREYYNIPDTVNGWYLENLITNLQSCGELEFKDKEGKYFAYPTGVSTYFNSATDTNLDEKEFSVQGLGVASTMTHSDENYGHAITITVKDSNTNAAGNVTWD